MPAEKDNRKCTFELGADAITSCLVPDAGMSGILYTWYCVQLLWQVRTSGRRFDAVGLQPATLTLHRFLVPGICYTTLIYRPKFCPP